MFGRRRRRSPDRNRAPRLPRPEVFDTIMATVAATVERADRSDVEFIVWPNAEPWTGTDNAWWVTLRIGDVEDEILVSPDGDHYVAPDESGYFENNLDGDKLAGFIRAL